MNQQSVNQVKKRVREIDPRICICRMCKGRGFLLKDSSNECFLCNGSGRVKVKSRVTTYVQAYCPDKDSGEDLKID